MAAILQFLVAVALAAGQPPAPQTPAPAPLIRCTLLPFRSAARPEGADVTLIVVSDGRPCAIPNWGVPVERRNPATAATISVAPKHGKAVFISPRMEYTADSGYAGEDEFAYEATVTDSIGADVVLRFRVKADVRSTPFAPPPSLPPPPSKSADIPQLSKRPSARRPREQRHRPPVDSALDEACSMRFGKWEFTPTVLGGIPTPVVMTVSVSLGCAPARRRPPPPAEAPSMVASPARSRRRPVTSRRPLSASLGRKPGPDFERGRQALERRRTKRH